MTTSRLECSCEFLPKGNPEGDFTVVVDVYMDYRAESAAAINEAMIPRNTTHASAGASQSPITFLFAGMGKPPC